MRTLSISALVVVAGMGLMSPNAIAQQGRTERDQPQQGKSQQSRPQQSRAQQGRDVQTVQQRYGVQGGYNTTALHPEGRPTAAVPVYLDDGRNGSGELLIPQTSEAHSLYYRDDSNGEVYPVRVAPGTKRSQIVQNPRIQRYAPETQHGNRASWEKDALIIGGSTGAGAVIGAAAGGGKGAGIGAVAGGVGGLIYDLATQQKHK
jgi:hypothetical protein